MCSTSIINMDAWAVPIGFHASVTMCHFQVFLYGVLVKFSTI